MNQFIKIIATVLVIAIILSCTGCNNFTDPDYAGEQKCQELLQYLGEKNAKGLKSMFCKKAKSSLELDGQIQIAMKFFQGKIVSHDSLVGISGDGEAVDKGKTTRITISPHITNIVTDAKKIYNVKFYSYLVCTSDMSKEGISDILITSSDGKQCEIGKYIE